MLDLVDDVESLEDLKALVKSTLAVLIEKIQVFKNCLEYEGGRILLITFIIIISISSSSYLSLFQWLLCKDMTWKN